MSWTKRVLLFLIAIMSCSLVQAFAAESGKFRVGAARIDVTPPQEEMPKPYLAIFDRIYARTIVVDNGKTRAVFATVDSATITDGYQISLPARIAREAGIPVEQVHLSTTHAHDSIRVSKSTTTPRPWSMTFNAKVEAALVEGVQRSLKNMQPARIGFGRGKSYINTNRMRWDPDEGRYVVGADRTGLLPSDKNVYVILFESLSGAPIALFANYGIMPIVHEVPDYPGSIPKIGGDILGATSLYIEKSLNEKVVALMTMGGGDQYPVYRVTRKGPGSDAESEVLTRALALMLGEEILATSRDMRNKLESGPIYGAMSSATCPGKVTKPINSPSACSNTPGSKLPPCVYKDEDGPPITLTMGFLLLGNIAIGGIWEDTVTSLIQHIQAISPYANTFVDCRFFGPARYLVSDDMYGMYTFESTDSRVKKGCAEPAILKAFQEMFSK
jgi:hypothetical protein